jgi:hypothetical protein
LKVFGSQPKKDDADEEKSTRPSANVEFVQLGTNIFINPAKISFIEGRGTQKAGKYVFMYQVHLDIADEDNNYHEVCRGDLGFDWVEARIREAK